MIFSFTMLKIVLSGASILSQIWWTHSYSWSKTTSQTRAYFHSATVCIRAQLHTTHVLLSLVTIKWSSTSTPKHPKLLINGELWSSKYSGTYFSTGQISIMSGGLLKMNLKREIGQCWVPHLQKCSQTYALNRHLIHPGITRTVT